MQVYLGEGGLEIMALVDTGSELKILPEDSATKEGLTTRVINMNSRVIGGHYTSIVELEEFTPITLVTGEERNIHLFVARGAVHAVLGRPFLAENNIRLDFSQQKGEIFSYIEIDGRRLCLPICSPQKVGWRENPPAGMETCAVSKLEYKNNCKSSIKPDAAVINVIEESRDLNSNPNTSALNSLKGISLKYKIIISQDLKPQDNLMVQEETIDSSSKNEESEELNKTLENIIVNQVTNGNDYGQETAKKEIRKTNVNNNMDESKPVLPQEVLRTEAPLKIHSNKTQKLQLCPSNMVNIDPRLIMEDKYITKENLQNSKFGIIKSEQEFSKEPV
ncbi:hypothetical protein O181_115865 [Austropuccinia psidii MF-1]|uniref:Peptidase A2 domain-containing protein n=1 Tax=Austropuccinia psidii MF-1 TaxID=1389203 RepID=A0A9Q3K794_9BASI|nr:hypothetical protein [Austropuccinia psidii MF-1]